MIETNTPQLSAQGGSMTKDQIDELMRENGIVVVGEAVYVLCNLVEEKSAAAERDKWEPVIAAVIRELPERMRGDKGNAPGHAHEIAGIWDSDNGDIAGTKCAWCAAWNTALEVIRARGQHD